MTMKKTSKMCGTEEETDKRIVTLTYIKRNGFVRKTMCEG